MLTIPAPIDAHLHMREGEELKTIVGHTEYCSYVILMPNTLPAVKDYESLIQYKSIVIPLCKNQKPLFTIKLTNQTTVAILQSIPLHEFVGVKLYPTAPNIGNVTFNSHDGVDLRKIESCFSCFDYMESNEIPLLGHWEMPTSPTFKREQACYKIIEKILDKFPKLKIVFEHITCKETVKFVKQFDNMRATITAHHMVLTIDDILGNDLNPYCFCKPIAKQTTDREALIEAAISGDKHFMYGSDSAYHPHKRKLKGKPGVYSSITAIPVITEIFDEKSAIQLLPHFLTKNAQEFYNLPETNKVMHLKQEMWIAPEEIVGTIPFMAGQLLKWKIVS